MVHMTTVVKIDHVDSGELEEECPYCKYDDAHKKPCDDCGEMHTPTPESFSRWLHRFFTNRGTKAHENEVKMYTTHARGGEHKNQIHNLRSSLRSGKPKKLRDWGKGRPKKAIINKLYDEEGCIYCRTNEIFKKRKIPTHKLVEEFRQSHHRALNSNPEFQKMSKEQKNEQLAAVEHDVKIYESHGRTPNDVHDMIDHVKRERKIDDANKALMAVSSPDDGETCNCQHGDHSNANGQQAGMYNQDLGRANWQGQGLPQPKQDKDSCQCDEKPAEADKVPNADARISDKEMKNPKKKGDVGHDTNMEEKFARRRRGGKGSGTAAKRTRRRQERIARQDKEKKEWKMSELDETGHPREIDRISAAKKKRKRGSRFTRPEVKKRPPEKRILAGMESLKAVAKIISEITKKKKKKKRSKRWFGTLTNTRVKPVEVKEGGEDIISEPIKPKKGKKVEAGREKIITEDNKLAELNRQIAERIINPYKPRNKIPPKQQKPIRTAEEHKEVLTSQNRDPITGRNIPQKPKKKKKKKEGVDKADKDAFPVFSDDKKKKKKKKVIGGAKETERLLENLSPAVLANMKRVEDANFKPPEKEKTPMEQSKVRGAIAANKKRRSKFRQELLDQIKRNKEAEKKKKKKKVKKKPAFPHMGIKAHGKKFDWEAFWKKHGLKKPEKKEKAKKDVKICPHCQENTRIDYDLGSFGGKYPFCKNCGYQFDTKEELKAEDTPYYDLLSDKPKKKKKPTKVLYRDLFEKGRTSRDRKRRQQEYVEAETANLKDKTDKCPSCEGKGTKTYQNPLVPWSFTTIDCLGCKGRGKLTPTQQQDKDSKEADDKQYKKLTDKAEENQFGAWGHRGLGDGNGTGARQDGGDTHLITPVKEEKLNELMRGIRYMPRSVSRKKKP